MFTTRNLSTIRIAVITLLLGALVAVSVPDLFWNGGPNDIPVVLAQESEGDGEEADPESTEEENSQEETIEEMAADGANTDDAAQPAPYEYLTVEVAENGYERFVPDETPVFEDDGLPAYGAEFITQGYIYPEGTLTCDDEGCNGVLEDGSPEFPDQVIGTWTCYGYHVGDGAHTETGPWVISTQHFSFGDEPGDESIVTNGYEMVDQNVPFLRAIIGGSGAYRYARGEQTQELLHFDPLQGTTLSVSFMMRSW